MKCEICGKKATNRFSPDLDIQGIGTCKKHLKDVMVGYVLLLQGNKKEYHNYMKGLRIKAKSKDTTYYPPIIIEDKGLN